MMPRILIIIARKRDKFENDITWSFSAFWLYIIDNHYFIMQCYSWVHMNSNTEIYDICIITVVTGTTKALFVTERSDVKVFWCAVSVWHHKEILSLTSDAEQSVYTIIRFHVVQWLGGLQYGLISITPFSDGILYCI